MPNIQEWLQQEPSPEEITINDDNSQTLGIDVVIKKLYKLDDGWRSQNFKQQWIPIGDADFLITSSLEIVTFYENRERVLVGAYTIQFSHYRDNKNIAGTLKSLCTINACIELGPQFGMNLNPKIKKLIPEKKEEYLDIDEQIKKQMNAAKK